MSSQNILNLLSRPGLEVVRDLFLHNFNRPLQTKFVRFILDPIHSELVISSLDESSDGEVGIYRNEYRWPYLKADLAVLLPYPMAVQFNYPLTFRQLRPQLLSRYGILLEENEFSLSAGAIPLTDDDIVDSTLVNHYGQFHLYAHANSGRFKENSTLSLIFIQPDRRVPLRALFDLKVPGILNVMAMS
jgi:hypothetical protein